MFDQTLIRICLIFGSLVTAWYILRRVRQAKVQIEDTIFWLLFSAALLILAIFRMFSRNTAKRAAENRVFMKFWNPVKNWFQYLWLSVRYCKKNRYFLCPHCGRIACVPRGTGKVTITCKSCRTKYDKKA